jgi:hypothetical protein
MLYYFKVVHGDNNETELVVSSNYQEIKKTYNSRKREAEEGEFTVNEIQELKSNKAHFNSLCYIE